MTLVPYTADRATEWNEFVGKSKNATFLFDRGFMDYHSNRFEDCSLMFEDKGQLVACLPANIDRSAKVVSSHGGLTYGGLLMSKSLTTVQVLDAFRLMVDYFRRELGAEKFLYKPIPYIYNVYPSDEDLYALFRMGAVLEARGVSSSIFLKDKIPCTTLRRRCYRKAERLGLSVSETDDVEAFWNLLNDVLQNNHGVKPVHSSPELSLLMSRFHEQIRLFVVRNTCGKILAGTLVFDMGKVVHTQYMAASGEGRSSGALDFLIHNLVTEVYADREYFDFGISTENGGKYLNEGLIFQKEGFGGRAVCYDSYSIDLCCNDLREN